MIEWDIYEFTSTDPIHAVKCRGRLRKFAIQEGIDLLTENATDKENCVRFAVLHEQGTAKIERFLSSLFEGTEISKVHDRMQNPILSKLKTNVLERYEI